MVWISKFQCLKCCWVQPCSCVHTVLPGDRQRWWLPWRAPRHPSLESWTMQESTASDSCYFLSQWSGKRKPSKVGELLTMQNPRTRKHKMTWSDWNSKTRKMQLWRLRDKDGEIRLSWWRQGWYVEKENSVKLFWHCNCKLVSTGYKYKSKHFSCSWGIQKIALPWTIFALFSSTEVYLFSNLQCKIKKELIKNKYAQQL